MLRIVFAGAIALGAVLSAVPAYARIRVVEPLSCVAGEAWATCQGPAAAVQASHFVRRSLKRTRRGYDVGAAQAAYGASWGRGGLVGPLAAKVAQIEAACGARLISGVRHTYIAGTRRISLHASGKAADLAGNPGCIYGQLQGWPGGYSIDYGRVRHVHISYDAGGGREMGLRFAHGGGRKHARRHHRHHRRLASTALR